MAEPHRLVTELPRGRRRIDRRELAVRLLIVVLLVSGFSILGIFAHYWLTGGGAG